MPSVIIASPQHVQTQTFPPQNLVFLLKLTNIRLSGIWSTAHQNLGVAPMIILSSAGRFVGLWWLWYRFSGTIVHAAIATAVVVIREITRVVNVRFIQVTVSSFTLQDTARRLNTSRGLKMLWPIRKQGRYCSRNQTTLSSEPLENKIFLSEMLSTHSGVTLRRKFLTLYCLNPTFIQARLLLWVRKPVNGHFVSGTSTVALGNATKIHHHC